MFYYLKTTSGNLKIVIKHTEAFYDVDVWVDWITKSDTSIYFLSIIPSSVNGGQLGSSSAKSFLAGKIRPATQASISA